MRPSTIDGDPAHHVVRPGPHGNAVAGDIEIELRADRRDAGEPRQHPLRIEMRHVEIDVRMPRLLHLADDGKADHVAGGKLGAGIVVGHETMAVAIDQVRAFAAGGLADQAAAAAGDVQDRGVELHELDVAQLGPAR